MSPNSDLETDGNVQPTIEASLSGRTSKRPHRRSRLRLNCGECRIKKLSCDRTLPCKRCVRPGRPELCHFETGTGQQSRLSNSQSAGPQAQGGGVQIRELQDEVAQLKKLLTEARRQYETDCVVASPHDTDGAESIHPTLPVDYTENVQDFAGVLEPELSDPMERSPRGYYSQHALFRFFAEIPQLFPFIKEISEEWFKPFGVHLKKNKPPRNAGVTDAPFQEPSPLEALLPTKDVTDTLVFFYLDNLEQLHRIIHIPTFKIEYTKFWAPEQIRHPAMPALVLAMISISCAAFNFGDSNPALSIYRNMPVQWISACDEWLRKQGSKHRKLVHYQVSCLVYVAKRMNMVSKKSCWNEMGSLIQNAIIDGLHCDPSPSIDTPYTREMKRRIWTVLRELTLQTTFEYGLATLLHNIDSSVDPPANVDDEEFDETSTELPMPKPFNQYTRTSYQSLSSHSWKLRLEISRRLFSPGVSTPLSYHDVLQYTHEITQAIDSLPSWDSAKAAGRNGAKMPVLAHAFLHFQLKECILALHRPYLQRDDGKYWLSETVCYQASRDILHLNSSIAKLGIRSFTLLREDLLLASLTLSRISILQPKDSNSIIMADSESTISTLEDCLPFMEDIYLRCFYGEPWCFLMLCAAVMLPKIHLGKESHHTAKASCARRFLDLHYKHIGRHQESIPSQQYSTLQTPTSQIDVLPDWQQPLAFSELVFPTSRWLDIDTLVKLV